MFFGFPKRFSALLLGKCTCVPSDAVIVAAASAKYTNTIGLGFVLQGAS